MTAFELPRRCLLQATAAAGLAAALPRVASAQAGDANWRAAVLKYLQGLAREGGGYGWEDQPGRAHLTPTYAAIGSLHLLGQKPANPAATAEYIRTHHPAALKKLEQEHRIFSFQQAQSLVWLGANAGAIRGEVLSWQSPLAYLRQYEQHGYPVFAQEVSAIVCRKLLGVAASELPAEYVKYLDARRRTSGSFNGTPAEDGSDGHVINTWWGLAALDVLGRAQEKRDEMVAWLRACQLPGGGFTYQPKPEMAGWDDSAYTWAAVKSLALLKAEPADRAACVQYLHSLWNSDGGFADRPGWASNPLATFYALDALAALGALEAAPPTPKKPAARPALPAGLKVWTIQIEAHGQGSPAEAVDLAQSLKIHLWCAKNGRPGWLAKAQAIADERKANVKFAVGNEEYGTWVSVPGLGTYSHTSDIVGPNSTDIGPSLANKGVATWSEYRERRLKSLVAGGGRLIWQFGENEPLVRLLLDDSLQRGGFAAISTFHFGNPDFTNSEPFLKRYRMQLPFVALQDAHGTEPWWFADQTTGLRTLFLAPEPTWEGWLTALKNNWVVAVRHDAVSGGQTWMHGGPGEVLDFVRANSKQWQWWDNPEIKRPQVSLVAVTPASEFESGKPQAGVAIRVRCAWENTTQGLPKTQLTELVKLTVDDAAIATKPVTTRGMAGRPADVYHLAELANLAAGQHRAIAVVRDLKSGAESSRSIEFTV